MKRIHFFWLGIIFTAAAISAFLLPSLNHFFSTRHHRPYQETLQWVQNSPEIISILGEPVKAGPGLKNRKEEGRSILQYPVKGPKAGGTVFVTARQTENGWSYEFIGVKLKQNGRDRIIDLSAQMAAQKEKVLMPRKRG